jgi:hypothetical protein
MRACGRGNVEGGRLLDGPTGRAGQKPRERREIKENSFFYKAILKFHFQKILNSFSFSVKTTHHKNKYAAA